MSSSAPLRSVCWWVCTKNPFYVVSAALVLLGLWISFGNQMEEAETWLLMGGMAGYNLLLAATALVLVRYLKLWDDARTVLLLVVLIFLATSVTFDHLLVLKPERGRAFYLIGLGLAIAVSEVLLHGIHLYLPLLYKLPYYLILALFFLYPLFVRALLVPEHPIAEPVMWALFGFATAAGLAFLTLLPALRRGDAYLQNPIKPIPWPWPLYPWSLFAMLAIAVPGRAILMCWSLHPLGTAHYDRLVFGPYFLVPFGFALAVLIVEMGLVLGKTVVTRVALAMPVLLLATAAVGHTPRDAVYRLLRVLTVPLGNMRAFDRIRLEPDPIYNEFLQHFSDRLGADPLFLTLTLAATFYGYAALRGLAWAWEGLSLALAAMAVIPTNALSAGWLVPFEPVLLLAAALLQLGLGVARRSAWNLLYGSTGLAGVIALTLPLPQPLNVLRVEIFVNLALAALLVLAIRHGALDGARNVGLALLLFLSLRAMHDGMRIPPGYLPAPSVTYPLLVGILLTAYGHFLRHSMALAVAALILGYWVFKFGWQGYRSVRTAFKGFDYIVSGLGFFAVAVIVSLAKAGMLNRWFGRSWRFFRLRQHDLALPSETPAENLPTASPATPETPPTA